MGSDGKECGVAHGTVRCIAQGNVANCGITNHKTEVKQGAEGTYNIEYKYTDTHGNPSKTVTRPVTIKDTTVPKLTLAGDCVLENSAGAHINAVDSKKADNTNGGLFDSDRIAKMFEHFDRCNKAITTTVTIHTGACKFDSGNTPGVQHCAGDAATQAPIQGNYLAKWTWAGTFNDKGSAATPSCTRPKTATSPPRPAARSRTWTTRTRSSRSSARRHRFGGRRPCSAGLQHAPHRGCHQRTGL